MITLALLFGVASTAVAQKTNRKPAPAASQPRVDKKLEREILGIENQLRRAIEKRDTVLLDRILADYYADSYEGSDHALGKRAAMNRCKNGALPYYSIDENRKISVRVDLVVIEGTSDNKTDVDNELAGREVKVTRFWTRKAGRWQLVSQTIGPLEEESEK
jgi:hypothetical protein